MFFLRLVESKFPLAQTKCEVDKMAVTTLFAAHSTPEPINNIKPTLALANNLGAHLNLVTYGVMETIPPAAYGGLPASYLFDAHDRVVQETNHRMALLETLVQELIFRHRCWLNMSTGE